MTLTEPYYHPEVGHIRFYSDEDRVRFLELIKAMLAERIDKLSLQPGDIVIVDNPEALEALVSVKTNHHNPIIVAQGGDIRTLSDDEVRLSLDRVTR